MTNFQDDYKQRIKSQLMKELELSNPNEVPKISKITVNMGVGVAKDDKKLLDFAVADLERITAQKVVVTRAKKSVAGFKIREGWPIGCKVTLRKKRMYDFLQKMVEVAFPRIQDFRGFTQKAFDGSGNYTFGLKEQIVFPEIDYDKIDRLRGMNITITTTATSDKEALALLKAFGFPFKKK